MLGLEDLAHLCCPACRGDLHFDGHVSDGRLAEGSLGCGACGRRWAVERGLGLLYDEAAVRGSDRRMRFLYDRFARLHDAAVEYTLPLFQVGPAGAMREAYLRRLELETLALRADGRPLRILEVGVGTGADLPLVRRLLPPGLEVEIWGLDLSRGMLDLCRRRLHKDGDRRTRLFYADAHALPLRDASFDRVFHVGGIAGFGDPARALAEMARVAKPGTPIVVVDEQLDRGRPQGLYHRLSFRLVTFYDAHPHCPVEHVPPGAMETRAEQLNRFFYCLSFRMPHPAPLPAPRVHRRRARG